MLLHHYFSSEHECLQFLIILTYIHIVEKPWNIETVLLSHETETEAVPKSDRQSSFKPGAGVQCSTETV